MAVDLNELLALPPEERMKLAETLMEGAAPPDERLRRARADVLAERRIPPA